MIKRIICCILLTATSFYVYADTQGSFSSFEWTKFYSKHYNFSYDATFRSFIQNIPLWEEILHPLKGKSDLRYLEIGVNQGRTAIWILENILTDPSATLM